MKRITQNSNADVFWRIAFFFHFIPIWFWQEFKEFTPWCTVASHLAATPGLCHLLHRQEALSMRVRFIYCGSWNFETVGIQKHSGSG